MSLAWSRRALWPARGNVARLLASAVFCLLAGLGLPTTSVAVEFELTAVAVESQDDALTVRLQTSRPPKYSVTSLGSPARIVIDLEGARNAWRGPLTTNPEPIREVRGSQWKPDAARVVVELSRPVGYSIQERSDGLVLSRDPGRAGRAGQGPRRRNGGTPGQEGITPGRGQPHAPHDQGAGRARLPRLPARPRPGAR
jgi:hypothetical protein